MYIYISDIICFIYILFLQGYEAEVRAREATKGLHKDLEGMFGALRRGDSNVSNPGSMARGLSAGGSISPIALVPHMSLLSSIHSPMVTIPKNLFGSPPILPSTSVDVPACSLVSLSASPVPSGSSSLDLSKISHPKLKAVRMVKAKKARSTDGVTKGHNEKDIVINEQKYRHVVPTKKFVLGHRSMKNRWTHWKLAMASQSRYLPSPRVSRATKRHPDMVGFKKPKLFTRDEPGDRALYEVAVQKCHRGFLKKYVMFSKVCTINDWAKWDKVLLSKPYVQKQINHVIENGGLVWVRRFKLSGMGKRQKESVNKYLHGRMYKYAWNPKTVPQKPGKLSWAIQTC